MNGNMTIQRGTGGVPRSFRNRVINGDMRIDQRNAGAAVTVNASSNFYPVDRFFGYGQPADGVFTLQQDSSDPDGFRRSVKATVTTADASIGTSQAYTFNQAIEGYNVADFGFGTSWAKNITLSFWVRSSVTGNFGAAVANIDGSRSRSFSYTISSPDTWEKKIITMPGDTAGSWEITNSAGLRIRWDLGSGSSVRNTADTWIGADQVSPTGSVSLIETLNATWYISGVQLEPGSTATEFEYRPIGTELQLVKRYGRLMGNGVSGEWLAATFCQLNLHIPTTMRVVPTLSLTTTTPTVAEAGGANRTGSSSTISYGVAGSSGNGGIINVDGFSGATIGATAFMSGDYIFLDAEL